jgi:hypothetical protein
MLFGIEPQSLVLIFYEYAGEYDLHDAIFDRDDFRPWLILEADSPDRAETTPLARRAEAGRTSAEKLAANPPPAEVPRVASRLIGNRVNGETVTELWGLDYAVQQGGGPGRSVIMIQHSWPAEVSMLPKSAGEPCGQ